jgi:hypothetical protein
MVKVERMKAYGLLAAVFVLGVIAGGGAGWALSRRDYQDLVSGVPEAFEHRRLAALSSELDLRPEQRERIADIFRRRRGERRQLMKTTFERCGDPLRKYKAQVNTEIHAVLDPAQRQRFDLMVKEQEERFFAGRRGVE